MKWKFFSVSAFAVLMGLAVADFGCASRPLPPPTAPTIPARPLIVPPMQQAPEPAGWELPFGPQPILDRPTPLPKPGANLGRYAWTYYWITDEDAARSKGPTRVIRDRKCKPIARVPREFARRLQLEGTGRLSDGRLVNAAGNCKCGSTCYLLADASAEFGIGVKNRPLSPFRSVAVDRRRVRIGTWLYIPELDGLRMPGEAPWGGFVHDGCVQADDVGGGVDGRHLDFFTADRAHYGSLMAEHKITRVTVHYGAHRCRKALALRTTTPREGATLL